MHKSLGNGIDPSEITDKFGADILRLWVASSDYHADIRVSNDILKQLSEVYRKIRNTARYILGNLYDFHPDTDSVSMISCRSWIAGLWQEWIRLPASAARLTTTLSSIWYTMQSATSAPSTCPTSIWTSSRTDCMWRNQILSADVRHRQPSTASCAI